MMNTKSFGLMGIVLMTLIAGCGGSSSSSAAPPPPPVVPPPPADTTPPTVNSTLPAGAAAGIDRFSGVSATFNESMNAATVNASSFTVVDANGAAVSGTVTFAAGSNTASFAPDNPLSLVTQYTATVSTAVTDTAGNALAAPMMWSFTIADGSWETAQGIDQGATFSFLPEQAIDVNGNVISVWVQDDGVGNLDVWANRYTAASGTWGMPQLLENDPGFAFNFALSMDDAGNAIAVWDQNDAMFVPQIWASRYNAANGTWGTAVQISDSAGAGILPSVATDPSGSAIAVWEQDDMMGTFDIRASRYSASSGTWSASTLVENSFGAAFFPSIAMDSSGNGIVVWEQEGMLGSFVFDVLANRYSAATDTWGTQVLLETSALDAFDAQIAIEADGDAVVIWEQEQAAGTFVYDIRANVYSAGTDSWDMAATLDNAAGDALAAQAGIDAAGNATAIWAQDDGAGIHSVLANRRPAGGTWGTAELLENGVDDVGPPQLAVGVNGDSIVSWPQLDGMGISDLYVNTYSSAAGAWGMASVIDNTADFIPMVRLASDAAGNAIAIWPEIDGMSVADHFSSRYLADTGAWSTPEIISDIAADDVGPPTLTINANGVAAAAWQRADFVSGAISIHGNQFD